MAETTLAAANMAITHGKRRSMARFPEVIGDAAAKGAAMRVLPEAGLPALNQRPSARDVAPGGEPVGQSGGG